MRSLFVLQIFVILFTQVLGMKIFCDFTKDTNTCKVTEIQVSGPSDHTVANVYGQYQSGKSASDVKIIDARGLTLERFPLNLNKFLQNIETVFFEKGMTEIHKEELAQYPNLKELYMSFNEIEVIEPNLFIHNPHLKLVFIGENKIHTVAPNVFDGLTELSYLGFDRNNCHDGHVENDRQGTVELIRDIYKNCAPISETGKCEAKVDEIVKEFQTLTSELREWKKEMINYVKLMKESCDIDQ